MNKFKFLSLGFLVSLAFIILSCKIFSDSKPKDSENEFEVNLFGKVVSGNGNSIPGVVATLKGYGISDTTESDGEYNLILKEEDTDQNSSGLLKSKAVPDTDTLEFSLNGQVLDIREVTVFIDTLPDFILVQRDINGKFSSNTDIDKIEAVLFIEGENDSVIIPLGYNTDVNSFSGFIYMKPNTGDQKFSLFVRVYDNNSSVIGRSSILEFDNKLGDIEFATFDPLNAYPSANAGSDTLLSINDSLLIIGTGSDVFGGSIIKYEWDFGNTGNFVEVSDGDTIIELPSSPDDNYQAILKVMDEDGNSSPDTIKVDVIKDEPVINIEGNTAVAINTPIEFIAETSQQFGGIVKYKWDDGIEMGIDDSTGSKFTVIYLEEKTFTVSVEVEDDDRNVVKETKTVVVTNDSPVIYGLKDTTISINDVITFTINASDTNGIKEYYWNFGDGSKNQFDTTTQNEISHKFPSESKVCTVSVAAVDSFDNYSIKTIFIDVSQDSPIPIIIGDTLVSFRDSIYLKGTASDRYGSILKWEWDVGNTGKFIETTPDSNLIMIAPSLVNNSYKIILKVTDDDENISLDTLSVRITRPLLKWTEIISGTDRHLFSIAGTDSQQVIVGWGTILSSNDFENWVTINFTSIILTSIIWEGHQFVAVGDSGYVITSSNGKDWAKRESNVTNYLSSIIGTGNLLVAVGRHGTITTSDDEGKTWVLRNSGLGQNQNLNSIIWTGTELVTVGDGGLILTSPDGINWIKRSSGIIDRLNSVVWSGEKCITVGNYGRMASSVDCHIWNLDDVFLPATLGPIIWTGYQYLLVAKKNNALDISGIYPSTNGIDWNHFGGPGGINSITKFSNSIIAVGFDGVIMRSPY